MKITHSLVGLSHVAMLVLLTGLLPAFAQNSTGDIFAKFQAQITAYYVQSAIPDKDAQEILSSQTADGSWPDIDYSSKSTDGNWDPKNHLHRVQSMAEVYVSPTSSLSKNAVLRNAIVAGLTYWMDKNYSNSNWWWRRIGIPRPVAVTLVLMGENIPNALVQKTMNSVLSDAITSIDPRRTGQNKVWMAGIELKKGWIRKDKALMIKAAEAVFSEIRTTMAEGIQPDWTFHQHHAQMQMGGYGLGFAGDQILWIYAMTGTEAALPKEKMEIFRKFLLEGQCWFRWNQDYDLNGMGRHLSGQNTKAANLEKVLREMMVADPAYKSTYESNLRWPNELIGNKVFWRSDFGIHRRPDWYSSVRMKSTRLIGGENTLGNNNQGLHGASGVHLIYLNGGEYDSIAPLWNWRRLPGTTIDQGISDIVPGSREEMKGNSDFAGGLGEGSSGVSAMIYKLGGLTAHKAWFFEKNAVICLGAGIDGPSQGAIFTSVDQKKWSGTVSSSMGGLTERTNALPAGGWVHQAGIGYKVENAAIVSLAKVSGNWNTINAQDPSKPVSGDIFSIWMDHGKSPKSATYAYFVYPQTTAAQMAQVIAGHRTKVLANTDKVQATEGAEGVHAVFYVPGQLKLTGGDVISVDKPCILSIRDRKLIVSDPTRQSTSVEVTVAGKKIAVKLPSGGLGGSQVEQAIEYNAVGIRAGLNHPRMAPQVYREGSLLILNTGYENSHPEGSYRLDGKLAYPVGPMQN